MCQGPINSFKTAVKFLGRMSSNGMGSKEGSSEMYAVIDSTWLCHTKCCQLSWENGMVETNVNTDWCHESYFLELLESSNSKWPIRQEGETIPSGYVFQPLLNILNFLLSIPSPSVCMVEIPRTKVDSRPSVAPLAFSSGVTSLKERFPGYGATSGTFLIAPC